MSDPRVYQRMGALTPAAMDQLDEDAREAFELDDLEREALNFEREDWERLSDD